MCHVHLVTRPNEVLRRVYSRCSQTLREKLFLYFILSALFALALGLATRTSHSHFPCLCEKKKLFVKQSRFLPFLSLHLFKAVHVSMLQSCAKLLQNLAHRKHCYELVSRLTDVTLLPLLTPIFHDDRSPYYFNTLANFRTTNILD